MKFYDHQKEAIDSLENGKILCGGTGSGKSITGLGYYYIRVCGGIFSDDMDCDGFYGSNTVIFPYVMSEPKDLYIITTARKRDSNEWLPDMIHFGLHTEKEKCMHPVKVVVDSWNNIKKYVGVSGAFFIFDEQRVVGWGAWTKSFLKIAKQNEWILLSATPGDVWSDYIPVFVANGFFKNKSEFEQAHVIYKPFMSYPSIDRYINVRRLNRLRERVLVDMDYIKKTEQVHVDIWCGYDREKYRELNKTRWDPYKDEPMQNASSYCYCLRRLCNEDKDREEAVINIVAEKKKAIIFYNFDYELEILKAAPYEVAFGSSFEIAELNGHKHQDIPKTDSWVYLVQYNAGAEAWNCITTDTIIFYSQTYSYRTLIQACGRIDRLNTPYNKLYYYHLRSRAPIDIAISAALKNKKKFNERRFYGE